MDVVEARARRTIRRVRRTLDDAGASLARARVLALCSGGIDSTVLVALLARMPRGAAPASVDVLFLDHGLRDDISAERAAAQAVARDHGATFHERRLQLALDAGAGGTQDAARTARYAAAGDVARELGCTVVVAGHIADDQLELSLLGLVGATNGSGAPATMAVARPLTPALRLVRPLLGVTRADVEAVAAELEVGFADDPSNADPDAYLRNALRHRVVPELLDVHPGAGAVLARSADRARAADSAIAGLADHLLGAWGNGDALDVRQLAPLHVDARRAVIARWLRTAPGGPGFAREVDARTVRAVDALVVLPGRAACARVDLPRGACVRRDGYDLHVLPSTEPPGDTDT